MVCETVTWKAAGPPSVPWNCSLASSVGRFHLEVIGHREDIWNAVGSQASEVLVSLAVDHTLQGDVAIFNDNVDRWQSAKRVTLERRLTEDGAVLGAANPIVKGRERQHLDVIVDLGDALDVFHG